jgi:hypothetical protein
MAFMAKDKIVRTGDDLNLATLVGLQANATALNTLAPNATALNALAADATVLGGVADAAAGATMTANNRIEKIAVVDLTADPDDTGGDVLAWANPEGAPIVVTRLLVNISDASGGAGTINFGVAVDATTGSDTLIDGADAEVAGFICNIKNAGTNGKSAATMSSTQFLTGTASASLTTFAGKAYIHYVLA